MEGKILVVMRLRWGRVGVWLAFWAFQVQLFVAVVPEQALAQDDSTTVRIYGVVKDFSGHPIAGAEARILGTNISALTSDSGSFRLVVVRVPPVLLQVRRPGYQATLLRIEGSWSGTISLRPGVWVLPEVEVTAKSAKPVAYANTTRYDDFFHRRHLGFGEFITRDQIDRRGAQHTAQLLEGRPGIKVDFRWGEAASGGSNTIIAFARCNEYPPKINVYIDGHKMQPRVSLASEGSSGLGVINPMGASASDVMRRREVRSLVGEMLERVNPSDIELMEIYRGPGELHAEFNDGNCGAIVIWTRLGGQ